MDAVERQTNWLNCLQVLSKASDEEPNAWWQARIKMLKGDFAVVIYVGMESESSEIVQCDRVRPINRNQCVNNKIFRRDVIEVPHDLRDV